MLDGKDFRGELGHDRPLKPLLGDPTGAGPHQCAAEHGRQCEPAERPSRPPTAEDEPAERACRGNTHECPPFQGSAESEPGGNAGAEADDEPGRKLGALRFEALFKLPVPLGKTRLPIAPSTLWQRRTRYVRGARPLHCTIREEESALERKHCLAARRYPFRALANRLPPYRRRAHRVIQLALCPPSRRQVPVEDR